jgi:hypothetical protein
MMGSRRPGFESPPFITIYCGNSPPIITEEAPPPPLINDLAEASFGGNLRKVQKLLQEWESMANQEPPRGLPSDPFAPFYNTLIEAVKNNHLGIVAFLLNYGFRCSEYAVTAVIQSKSIELFQIFFDHGWDINESGWPKNEGGNIVWIRPALR